MLKKKRGREGGPSQPFSTWPVMDRWLHDRRPVADKQMFCLLWNTGGQTLPKSCQWGYQEKCHSSQSPRSLWTQNGTLHRRSTDTETLCLDTLRNAAGWLWVGDQPVPGKCFTVGGGWGGHLLRNNSIRTAQSDLGMDRACSLVAGCGMASLLLGRCSFRSKKGMGM